MKFARGDGRALRPLRKWAPGCAKSGTAISRCQIPVVAMSTGVQCGAYHGLRGCRTPATWRRCRRNASFSSRSADVLARRNEARLDPAIRSDGRNATDQSQRLDDAVAQVHFEHALLAHLRQRRRALPDAAKRIESDCGRLRSWMARCQQLPDHVEQQIDLHVEADDVG